MMTMGVRAHLKYVRALTTRHDTVIIIIMAIRVAETHSSVPEEGGG